MFAQVLSQSYQARTLPGRHDFTASMLWTSAALVLLPNLLAILARKKSRKLLLDTLESILAVVLVTILLGIVLGLPVGMSLHARPSLSDDGDNATSTHTRLACMIRRLQMIALRLQSLLRSASTGLITLSYCA